MNNSTHSLLDNLLHFIQRNREDNLHKKSGWHERLREIYVSHHKDQQKKTGHVHSHQQSRHDVKK